MPRTLLTNPLRLLRAIVSCDISFKHLFKLSLPHPVGIVIAYNTKIGKNVKVYPNVVIGGKNGKPSIEDGVCIYSNSSVIGNIKLGTGCIVGANSLVRKDIPPNEVWAGSPARKIKEVKIE